MARPTLIRQVDRVAVTDATGYNATVPNAVIRDQNFPSGDMGLKELNVRVDGAITVSGGSSPTLVTDGEKKILSSLTVETDKHGKLVDNVDGLGLYRIAQSRIGANPDADAVSATPADADTWYSAFKIPFADEVRLVRPFDGILDMSKSRMKVTSQYGPRTNVFGYTGGSPAVKSITQSIEAVILPGPLNQGVDPNGAPDLRYRELPAWIPTLERSIIPISATATRYQIQLPFGDRIYRRIFISQRENAAGFNELATVVVGTAEVSVNINNTPVVDRRIFQDIQSENKERLWRAASLPTGWAVLDFDQTRKFNDMLWAITKEAGNMYLYLDVTAVSNGQLWLYFDCFKPIPEAAAR